MTKSSAAEYCAESSNLKTRKSLSSQSLGTMVLTNQTYKTRDKHEKPKQLNLSVLSWRWKLSTDNDGSRDCL